MKKYYIRGLFSGPNDWIEVTPEEQDQFRRQVVETLAQIRGVEREAVDSFAAGFYKTVNT